MRFWDSSAIVPLLVEQPSSARVIEVYGQDPEIGVWWATEVECASALARLERDGTFDAGEASAASERLASVASDWLEVEPRDPVRRTAIRLLRTHALRAADAMQIAAALALASQDPSTLEVVTLDTALARAAEREGLRVIVPAD